MRGNGRASMTSIGHSERIRRTVPCEDLMHLVRERLIRNPSWWTNACGKSAVEQVVKNTTHSRHVVCLDDYGTYSTRLARRGAIRFGDDECRDSEPHAFIELRRYLRALF